MVLRCIGEQKRLSLLNWMKLLRYHQLATAEINAILDYVIVIFKLKEMILKSLKLMQNEIKL